MSRILFDLEGNGFLPELSRIHCIACVDVDTEERRVFGPTQIAAALDYFAGNILIAHNGIGYDYPALEKLYGYRVPADKQLDTLVLARLIHPNIAETDKIINASRLKAGEQPLREFTGKHSLRAWGLRLRIPKADFEGPWDGWTQQMQDYCVQDVETNLRLWRYLNADGYSASAIALEHDIARSCRRATEAGWYFDVPKAQQLHAALTERKAALEEQLIAEFKGWTHEEEFVPKVSNKKRGYVKGVPFIKRTFEEFNPQSREHIGRALLDRGWKPAEFTDGGKPKMDEEVIEGLVATFPDCGAIGEYLMLSKRIGQLATGNQAWLHLHKDGIIHHTVNPMGAVTSRASHNNPNIAQVPRIGTPYGRECRELFIAPPGFKLLGADMKTLEGRCLAHYLAKYDGGEYGKLLLHGDPHWKIVQDLGLIPGDTDRIPKFLAHDIVRDCAKTGFYAMLYGCGDGKMGKILLDYARKLRKACPDYAHVYSAFFRNEAPTAKALRDVGAAAKFAVIQGIDGFSQLKKQITKSLESGPSLPALDHRRLPVRSEHAALNTLLQSAGAILCKRWKVDAESNLTKAGLKWGYENDFVVCGWIHDELQIAVREGLEDQVGPIVVAAAQHAGEPYGFRLPLDSSYKVGASWADTH